MKRILTFILSIVTILTVFTACEKENNEREKITFGSYPQSEVTDSALKTALNEKAGNLPLPTENYDWTPFKKCLDDNGNYCMWFIDIEIESGKYRGLYFTSYRPYHFSQTAPYSEETSNQDDNGYLTKEIYWFKYEPLTWTVLSKNENDKTAFLLCDSIIDAQYYYSSTGTRKNPTRYANNYQHSDIRTWLNETFFDTAFTDSQKSKIKTTKVNNGLTSTGYNANSYVCETTEDKIFLPSRAEMTNSQYGFSSNYADYDTARQKKPTAYAKALGAWQSSDKKYANNGTWWLRTPSGTSSAAAHSIGENGYIYGNHGTVPLSNRGVVPAMNIKL